jgi:hypothetical protein
VLDGVGEGARHAPLRQTSPGSQHSFPQAVWLERQVHRRRPRESSGPHSWEQHWLLELQEPPPSLQAAASLVRDQTTAPTGPPSPTAVMAAFRIDRRDDLCAICCATRSKRPWSNVLTLIYDQFS